MSKPMTLLLVAFITAALVVAWKFGGLGIDQMAYLGNMVVGWSLWTLGVAIAYAGLEKLFPSVLCPPPADDASVPRADGTCRGIFPRAERKVYFAPASRL